MKPRRRPRAPERGNSLVLAMIVMSALATLSGLTVLTVQGGITTTNNDRFHTMATYAAESGVAAAMDFLRVSAFDDATKWSAFVEPGDTPNLPAAVGNQVPPTDPNSPFSIDQQSSYRIELYNNKDDPGLGAGNDTDGRIIIRVIGFGPNQATATIELEISRVVTTDQLALVGWRKVL